MTTFAQGEVYIRTIKALPVGLAEFDKKTPAGDWLISHSEKGNHHLIEAGGVDVLEQKTDVPAGVRILYAIVKEPSKLRQSGSDVHGEHHIAPGLYEIRISREYDPFTEQARQVMD